MINKCVKIGIVAMGGAGLIINAVRTHKVLKSINELEQNGKKWVNRFVDFNERVVHYFNDTMDITGDYLDQLNERCKYNGENILDVDSRINNIHDRIDNVAEIATSAVNMEGRPLLTISTFASYLGVNDNEIFKRLSKDDKLKSCVVEQDNAQYINLKKYLRLFK